MPADLAVGDAGMAAVVFDADGQVEEVREWDGRSWDLLVGRERDALVGWLQS